MTLWNGMVWFGSYNGWTRLMRGTNVMYTPIVCCANCDSVVTHAFHPSHSTLTLSLLFISFFYFNQFFPYP